MSQNIICTVLIFIYVAGFAVGNEPGEEENGNPQKCTKIGPRCSANKSAVELCLKLDDYPNNIKVCQLNEKCKEEENFVGCVSMEADTSMKFICHDIGEFPDPSNCRQTFKCNKKNSEPAEVCTCLKDYTVDPTSDLHCVRGACQWKDITCNDRGGTFGYFTMKENDVKTKLCYYCQNSTAINVFKDCESPDQQQYARRVESSNDKKCIPMHWPPTESTGTATAPTEGTSFCKNVGDLHITECDCDYYKCDKNLIPIRKTCPDGMHFNEKYKKCLFGDCDPSKCISGIKP